MVAFFIDCFCLEIVSPPSTVYKIVENTSVELPVLQSENFSSHEYCFHVQIRSGSNSGNLFRPLVVVVYSLILELVRISRVAGR